MVSLQSHWLPIAAIGTLGAADAAAASGATPLHFAAAGFVLMGIVAVVKGYVWVDDKVGARINGALELHEARDETRHEVIRSEIAKLAGALGRRPCIAGKCNCGQHDK